MLCVAVRFLGEGILSVEKWVGKVSGVHRNMGAEKAGHIGQESSSACRTVVGHLTTSSYAPLSHLPYPNDY